MRAPRQLIAAGAAAVLCAGGVAVASASLPALRRMRDYGRRRRQQVVELLSLYRGLAADVAVITKQLGRDGHARQLRVVEEGTLGALDHLPDTARTHKLLEVTSRKIIESVERRIDTAAEEIRGVIERAVRLGKRDLYGDIDGLEHLVRHVLRSKPGSIVELGSGVTTVLLALAVRQAGTGRVTSVEHSPDYAERTRLMLRTFDVGEWANICIAPLHPIEIGDETFDWYDLSTVDLPDEIDLLVVDGPPDTLGPQSRFPAVPLLRSRLAANGVVILDDARRNDEAAIVERWCEGYALRLAGQAPSMASMAELIPDDAVSAAED